MKTKTKTIAICIGKGGQLKTTTVCNMAYVLNKFNHRTLVIDVDPQCNATLLFNAKIKDTYTIYDCFIENRRPENPNNCIQKTDKGDIIAGDSLISELTAKIYDGTIKFTDFKTKVLDKVDGYEYIIIDCPPDLTGFINKCILSSVDEVLVPCKGDRFSVKGLSDIIKVIGNVKENINPQIKINGILLTNFQGNTRNGINAYENAKVIAHKLNTTLYETKIRLCAKGQEAIDVADFVCKYSPACTSSLDYFHFTEEFLNKEKEERQNYGEEQ